MLLHLHTFTLSFAFISTPLLSALLHTRTHTFHSVDHDHFRNSQLASTQLTSGPYVVLIWSRNMPELRRTKHSQSTVWRVLWCAAQGAGLGLAYRGTSLIRKHPPPRTTMGPSAQGPRGGGFLRARYPCTTSVYRDGVRAGSGMLYPQWRVGPYAPTVGP